MTPIQLITFAKSRVEKIGRASGVSVVGTAEGDNSRDYDSEIYQSHGIVSRPSGKTRGIRIRIGNLAFVIASYTYGVEPPENEGATKLYSTDASGTEKASHLLDSNGKHTFNNGTDFAVRFSALETAFNELKGKYNALVTAYNAHVHTGVTTGSGASGTTVSAGTASTADISTAKVEEILIP
jgi:hypothetical protein